MSGSVLQAEVTTASITVETTNIHIHPRESCSQGPPGSTLPNPPNGLGPTPTLYTRFATSVNNEGHKRSTSSNSRTRRPWKTRQVICAVYNHLLFKFPHIYFSRVQRIFERARLSDKDLKLLKRLNGTQGCIVRAGMAGTGIWWMGSIEDGGIWSANALDSNPRAMVPLPPDSSGVFSPRNERFLAEMYGTPRKNQWEVTEELEVFEGEWTLLINGASQEWTTMNIVSALLLTAVLTLLQMDTVVSNAFTRTFVFLALSSAIISLILGCSFILRFSNMKTLRKAARWVEHSQANEHNILWNVWVLLSLPAVWLTWSGIEFCVAVLSLLWTLGPSTRNSGSSTIPLTSTTPPPAPSPNSALYLDTFIPRLIVTVAFFAGCIHGAMMVKTFLAWAQVEPGVILRRRTLVRAVPNEPPQENAVRLHNVTTPIPRDPPQPPPPTTQVLPPLSSPSRSSFVIPMGEEQEDVAVSQCDKIEAV